MGKNLRVWWLGPDYPPSRTKGYKEHNGLVVGSFGAYSGFLIVRNERGKLHEIPVGEILRSEWE